jgi:hypothetical protein
MHRRLWKNVAISAFSAQCAFGGSTGASPTSGLQPPEGCSSALTCSREKFEIRYVGKETDRKWEEGEEISILEFAATEYGRRGKVVATEEVKAKISSIGINKCARESGLDRKNFIRKLVRGGAVKRNSYNEFVRWLQGYKA